MKQIQINQAKPNPSGKDRSRYSTPNSQLNAEWVDIKNIGDENYPLNGIKLQHIAYGMYGTSEWHDVIRFNISLAPNEVVRVHSGEKVSTETLPLIDREGADHHLFTKDNKYVWNNDKSDSPRLVLDSGWSTTEIDKATYDAYPPEGKILKRVGEKLIDSIY